MQHFVNNVERYLVNQIIHISWQEFQNDLQNSVSSSFLLLFCSQVSLTVFMKLNLSHWSMERYEQTTTAREIRLEDLYQRRWYQWMCHFFNLRGSQCPWYWFAEIPNDERNLTYNLRTRRDYINIWGELSVLPIRIFNMPFLNGTYKATK